MKKIISLFQRNYDGDKLIRNEIVLGAEWVVADEGIATRKYDGTCCMIRDGKLYKRYDVKKGKKPPKDFEPAQDQDEVTGHMPGWIPVSGGPEDKWHREAFDRLQTSGLYMDLKTENTYELLGPKIQGNPEGFDKHILLAHSSLKEEEDCPRTFEALKEWFKDKDIEGIVWHHTDGRMVKIKKKDFGFKRV